MPFVLTQDPATFHELIDTIFKNKEDCVEYMYDILFDGGTTEAEYQAVVEKVLQRCIKHGVAVNLTKFEIHIHETIFSGHIINGSQVQMDPAKLETMFSWPVHTRNKEVQAFLGIANYYRRFIESYIPKARLLMNLTKDVLFS